MFQFMMRISVGFLSLSILLVAHPMATGSDPNEPVDFAREIQPILANHCWSCHGPDEKSRQGDLRLDLRDRAIAASAFVPGDAKGSKLLHRVHSNDPDLQMPPPDSKKPLNAKQIELLQRWIQEGARYAEHWAFRPIESTNEIEPFDGEKIQPIDAFVKKRLTKEGMKFASEADRATLLRRVSLDLTGLPPSPQELDAFLSDPSPDAYEKVVDRLLASKHYAERMALQWLDLARYADTNGYNNDEDRNMWPWRDWVIRAFDENMPYDQFVIEQLAGDLLPNPTRDQLVATAFLRNQGHNTEGGIIQEEYRVEYVADRVHTTATVFLGLSMQCARCHDHKYDPIAQKEYYQFYAYFNSLDEKQASYSKFVAAEPFIRVPSAQQQQQLAEIDAKLAQVNARKSEREGEAIDRLEAWLAENGIEKFQSRFSPSLLHHLSLDRLPVSDLVLEQIKSEGEETRSASREGKVIGSPMLVDWTRGDRNDGKEAGLGLSQTKGIEFDGKSYFEFERVADFDGATPFSLSVWVFPTTMDSVAILSKMDESSSFRGFDLLLEGGKLTSHLVNHWPENGLKVATKQPLALNQWHHVVLAYDGSRKGNGIQFFVDSKSEAMDVLSDGLSGSISTEKPFHVGLRGVNLPFRGKLADLRIYQGKLEPQQVDQVFHSQPITTVLEAIRIPRDQRNEQQTQQLKQLTLNYLDSEYPMILQTADALQKEKGSVEESFPGVMVLKEMVPPRETFLLKRGQYDQPGEQVSPRLPAVFGSIPEGYPNNRLGLAKWLFDPKNPLTARVAVNRWWQHFFGTGLVKSLEDFGITGEPPSHPELLDYLGSQLIAEGWNVKAMQKRIVMSATYRQDSRITLQNLERDPENRLLARGPRYRLSAETVRDNALAVSGLLQNRIGGPSVKPYQPAGLWEDVTVDRRGKYVEDQGEGLYRRSMYTFWKRTCPPPSMMSFDAPNREVCIARRARTNTPLQSLVLLNDPTYVEAARALAQAMIREGGTGLEDRMQVGFRRCLARRGRPEELEILKKILQESKIRFDSDPNRADELNQVGAMRPDSSLGKVEVAAWTIVASTLLNLDETISKR